MTGWDILNNFISSFPPIVMSLMLLAFLTAVVIFIIGFSKHGVNFLKYGFKQTALDNSLEKRFDSLEAKFDERFSQIDARFMAIETNHFGHLKNFLSELTSILLDRNIINNTEKTRLDNQLRDM